MSTDGKEKYPSNRARSIPCLCIAGTHSGCGKTTVTLGVLAALKQRGMAVRAFKVGPDFIDPGHHRRITGRDSHNLDGWMMDRATNEELFTRNIEGADIAVVEGVMGLYDGFSGGDEFGSTAQMVKWLDLPLVLVIDARSMARSAAAMALGYASFDKDLTLSGVIFNRVGSAGHAEMLREAMGDMPDLPVFGCLLREDGLEIPSRHLGLVTDEDFGMDETLVSRLAGWIEDHLDLDGLLASLTGKAPAPAPLPAETAGDVPIGVARDEAFCFYYPENLRLLEAAGARIIPFSPLRDQALPEGVRGLLFGGGYPELHCRALSANHLILKEIRAFGREGRPIYAECGGFMYLMREITDLEGKTHPMAGIFPMAARMETKLRVLGYREIVTRRSGVLGPAGTRVRGHEFHYSGIDRDGSMPETVYDMSDRKQAARGGEGYLVNRVLGSYVHLHWGSNPDVAGHFVSYCRQFG